MRQIKVILPVHDIPNKSTVTKPSGTTQYVLTREIRFFPKNKSAGERHSVAAKDGCVFLVNDQGDVSVYPPTVELAWLVDADELRVYLDQRSVRWYGDEARYRDDE